MESEETESVLIVDDDNDTRLALERSLRRLGYEARLAVDGEEGLKMVMANPPTVVLADLRMPRMDGHTLVRRLRQQDLDTAVVVMSAHGTMDDVVDAMRNGAVDYLKKPWTQSELVTAVGHAAEIAETRRSIRRGFVGAARPSRPGIPVGFSSSPGTLLTEPSAGTASNSGSTGARPTASPPAIPATHDSIFHSVLDQLRRGEVTLPAIPVVLTGLRSLLTNPETTIEEVVGLVEQDQRSAVQVIRLANSVQYSGLTRVNDIRNAVNRIGFRQLENIVQTAFAQSCYRATGAQFLPLQSKIWRYSVARAVSMRALAELAGPASGLNPATAYLAGLMSDAGAAFLLWLSAERERSGTRVTTTAENCLSMIRAHHQEVGEVMARSWGLDAVVALVAGSHHAEAPPTPPSRYWSLSILASVLASQLVQDDDVTCAQPASSTLIARCGAELRIDSSALKNVLVKLGREVDGLIETLS